MSPGHMSMGQQQPGGPGMTSGPPGMPGGVRQPHHGVPGGGPPPGAMMMGNR